VNHHRSDNDLHPLDPQVVLDPLAVERVPCLVLMMNPSSRGSLFGEVPEAYGSEGLQLFLAVKGETGAGVHGLYFVQRLPPKHVWDLDSLEWLPSAAGRALSSQISDPEILDWGWQISVESQKLNLAAWKRTPTQGLTLRLQGHPIE